MKFPAMSQSNRAAFINAFFMNNLAKTPSKASLCGQTQPKNVPTDFEPGLMSSDSNIKPDARLRACKKQLSGGSKLGGKISKRKRLNCSPRKLKQQRLEAYKAKQADLAYKKEDDLKEEGLIENTEGLRNGECNENAHPNLRSANAGPKPPAINAFKALHSEFENTYKNTESKATAPSIHNTRFFAQRCKLESTNPISNIDSFFNKKETGEGLPAGAYHTKLIDFIKKNKFEAPAKLIERPKETKKQSRGITLKDELAIISNQKNTFNAYPDHQIMDYHLSISYKVGRLLGKGSFAEVRQATRISDGLPVAVKTYTNSSMNVPYKNFMIQNEIRVLKSIDHRNIVRLLDIVVSKDYTHLIIEYCEGINLYEYMWNRGRVPLSEPFAHNIFVQLLDALDYLHSKSIYHRDLKLDNIMLDKSGKVTLIDFGFAIIVNNNEPISSFCGTPNYMAPEIYQRKKYSGAATDIWALTVILYKLVVGEFPFKKSDKDKSPKTSILEANYDKPSRLSSALLELFAKVFVLNPETRASMSDLKCHSWLLSL